MDRSRLQSPVGALEFLNHLRLAPVGADGLPAADRLLDQPVQLPQGVLLLAESLAGVAGDIAGHGGHPRHHDQAEQRQRDVERQHHRHHPGQSQQAGEKARHILAEHRVHVFDIVGQAAHEVAVRVLVEVAQG